MIIYIIISNIIRYLLWNRRVWRFFHDTYLTIEVQGIRCTHHLNHSCPLTDVNPHFTAPGCRYYFKINSWWPIVTSSTHGPAARLLWRHNEPLFPRVSMDAWCWGRHELQGLPAKPWIVWHMTSSFCISWYNHFRTPVFQHGALIAGPWIVIAQGQRTRCERWLCSSGWKVEIIQTINS